MEDWTTLEMCIVAFSASFALSLILSALAVRR